jgi:hypothetical protein
MWIFKYYYSLFAAALAYFEMQSDINIRPARFGTRAKSLGRYTARRRIRLQLLLAALTYHAFPYRSMHVVRTGGHFCSRFLIPDRDDVRTQC